MERLPSVKDILITSAGGAWSSKSGGELNILYKIDFTLLTKLLTYDDNELAKIPHDIRGLRSYRVQRIPQGSVGANEWHKIRNELVFSLNGKIKWTCKDSYGEVAEYILDGSTVVFTPHHILHTYTALSDNATIAVVANTLFLPDNPSTYDTYSADLFPH